MAKITLNIEAETAAELQETLKGLQVSNVTTEIKVNSETVDTEEVKKATKTVAKATKKEKSKEKKDSTGSTSEAKNSTKPKEDKPAVDDEPATSTTPNNYPDATKEDVTKAVKKALADKKRDAVKTALERQGVGKVPELDPANYGVFLTDLEILVGE